MAAKGKTIYLSKDQLETAFNNAKEQGADYLFKMGYAVKSSFAVKGFGLAPIESSEWHQVTIMANEDNMEETFRRLIESVGHTRMISALDLSKNFENAVMQDMSGPQQVLSNVRQQVEVEQYQKRMDERPFWRKALGLGPA